MMKKLELTTGPPQAAQHGSSHAAILQNYKRNPGESISAYLVRETLFFEEFLESLMDLKDRPADFVFDGVDPDTDEEENEDDGSSQGGLRSKGQTKGYEKVLQDDPDPESASRAPSRRGPPALSTTEWRCTQC